MKSFRTLGDAAGGFLMSAPPRSVLTAILWLGARTHPAISMMLILVFLSAWIKGASDG
ncbi:hypothetical protein [Shimia marina]|uniref:Uncharacterized protein n=1 Tax=Shimia marina TaxID=321267 RepID=A0A0P1EPL3_9RHOB|nr:hypothetical protein [Shimia marina]CUH52069.1 hypothetical protein SHM7688_01509 [Shimia marina]SFE83079.1 hypothetical protein SAMN04488037_1301 [Shimia marina]